MDKILRYKRIITIILLMFITITSIPIDVIAKGIEFDPKNYPDIDLESASNIRTGQEFLDFINAHYGKGTGYISSIDTAKKRYTIQINFPDGENLEMESGYYYETNVSALREIIIERSIPNNMGIMSKEEVEKAHEEFLQEVEEALKNREGLENIKVSTERMEGSLLSFYTHLKGVPLGNRIITEEEFQNWDGHKHTIIADLISSTVAKLGKIGKPLTKQEIITLINTITNDLSKDYDKKINVTIIENSKGELEATFELNGDPITKTFKIGDTAIEVEELVSSAITELLQKLNTFIGELTGDFTGNVFGHSTIRQLRPLGLEGTGGIMTWVPDKKEKLLINRFTIPGKKDMNGDPIEMVAYGQPFGGVKNGQHRFLGYCPKGYPLTNPFYPDDITSITPLWNRGQFFEPWENPELEGRFKTDSTARRYMVSLEKIDKVDGNKELNKLTWMGLKFHWSTHVSASDEFKDWHEVVKIQVPPTDDTWGMAYYPSKVNGGFRYVTIPIPPQSMLGIDIKTDTVISTPQIVTGNKVEIKTVYSIHNVKSAKDKKKFLNMDFDATVKSPLFGEKKYS